MNVSDYDYDFDYDYVASKGSREGRRLGALGMWKRRTDRPSPSTALLIDEDGPAMAAAVAQSLALSVDFDGVKLRLALPRLAPAILARIDARACLGDIHEALRTLDAGLDWATFEAQFDQLYRVLNGLHRLLLRYRARYRALAARYGKRYKRAGIVLPDSV